MTMLRCEFCGHESLYAVCRTMAQRDNNCPHYAGVLEQHDDDEIKAPPWSEKMVKLKDPDLYNNTEKMLLALVPGGGKRITSLELVKLRKQVKPWKIAHPRNALSTIMRRLIEKIQRNNEEFRLCKSPQNGPQLMQYWIERNRV